MQGNQNQTAVVQKPNHPVVAFKEMLKEDFINDQLTSALNENKGAFVASLVELYTGDKSLQTCNPKLVAMEAVKAASLNLPINKALGFAYIVVYNNSVKTPQGWMKVPTPTFVLGYKGYIQLASRTGEYKTINATPVYDGEFIKRDRLTGYIDVSGEKISDKVVGYAGYIEYRNGFSKAEYMTVEEMAKHAIRFSPSIPKSMKVEDLISLASKEPEGKKVGWLGNFNDMAVKTILRRLISKYGYMSVQMQKAFDNDNMDSQVQTREEIILENISSESIDLTDEVIELTDTTPASTEATETNATPEAANEAALSDEVPY